MDSKIPNTGKNGGMTENWKMKKRLHIKLRTTVVTQNIA